MKETDDMSNQPLRYRAEVRRAKIVKKSKDETDKQPETDAAEEAASPAAEATEQESTVNEENGAEPAAQSDETAADSKEEKRRRGDEPYVDNTVRLPSETFDYVVPKETWKQHARRRHRSEKEHSGTMQETTAAERREAEAGFVFHSGKKHRSILSFLPHRHHHHHHRHHRLRRRFKKLATWKKILIITGIVILSLIIALSGTFLILKEIGRRSMLNLSDAVITLPAEDGSGRPIEMIDQRGHAITYDGHSYQLNENLVSVVFIGADEGTSDNAHLQMADAIFVLTIDTKTGESKILGVNRDTMADVGVYSVGGNYIGTERQQITYSYSYGNDNVTGGENTEKSLERLFFGLPFENYFAINLDALIDLNDAIGGVTLTSSITFQSREYSGVTFSEGETITLHGKDAEYYVRTRDTERLESSGERLKRQQEYIRAFISSIVPSAKKNLSVISDLYQVAKANSDTTLNVSKMTYLASVALPKLNSGADIEMVSLRGTYTKGEQYAEWTVTDEDALRTMLEVFYKQIG